MDGDLHCLCIVNAEWHLIKNLKCLLIISTLSNQDSVALDVEATKP